MKLKAFFDLIGELTVMFLGPSMVAFGIYFLSSAEACSPSERLTKIIGYFTLFGVVTTFSLYKQLVINDNSRNAREEQKETFEAATRMFKRSNGMGQNYIQIIKKLRLRHKKWTWSILRAYQELSDLGENPFSPTIGALLIELAAEDPDGNWPTPKKWGELFGL